MALGYRPQLSYRPNLGYRPALDGMRACAVFAVMGAHFSPDNFANGMVGVDVFFAISGFLITRLLCEEYEQNGGVDVREFWMRRVFRLMPAVWVLLAVCVVLAATGLIADSVDDSLRGGWQTLLYIRNWFFVFGNDIGGEATAHTWSLAVEEQFYVIWPLAFVFIIGRWGRRNLSRMALAGAVAATIETAALYAAGVSWTRMWFALDARAAISLLLGAALGASTITRIARDTRISCGIAWIAAVCVLALPVLPVFSDSRWMYGGWAMLAAATCSVIIEATRRGSLLEQALSWPPLVYIGTMSYSIYLWHLPMLGVAKETIVGPGHRGVTYAAVATVLTAIAASASFYLIEQPCRRWGRRWLERRHAPAAREVVAAHA